MEYYLAMKRNEALRHATVRMKTSCKWKKKEREMKALGMYGATYREQM